MSKTAFCLHTIFDPNVHAWFPYSRIDRHHPKGIFTMNHSKALVPVLFVLSGCLLYDFLSYVVLFNVLMVCLVGPTCHCDQHGEKD